MDAHRFKHLARRMSGRANRRQVLAALGASAGAARLGWLRQRAAAVPSCGNCDCREAS